MSVCKKFYEKTKNICHFFSLFMKISLRYFWKIEYVLKNLTKFSKEYSHQKVMTNDSWYIQNKNVGVERLLVEIIEISDN